MMKMTILAPRRRGMTHEQFRDYVVNVHGPLVKSVPEVAAEIRHYHYNFPIVGAADAAFGHQLAELDILTQGFFDSREAQLDNMRHERFMTVLRPDEQNFADTERAMMHYCDEHEVRAGTLPDTLPETKVFYLRRRRDGLGREEFQERWLAAFGDAVLDSPLGRVASRIVQNHVQAEEHHPDGANPRFYDVLDEIWLPDFGAFAALSPADVAPSLRAIETELLEPARTRAFVVTMVPNIR